MRFSHSLLDGKSEEMNPDILKRLPKQPVTSALGVEPKGEEITTAMKAMAISKTVEPAAFPWNC